MASSRSSEVHAAEGAAVVVDAESRLLPSLLTGSHDEVVEPRSHLLRCQETGRRRRSAFAEHHEC